LTQKNDENLEIVNFSDSERQHKLNGVTTWYSDEELDGVLVSVKAQLSLGDVAVWNEATGKHTVCRRTAIDPHCTIRRACHAG